jgi:hypothetical protein
MDARLNAAISMALPSCYHPRVSSLTGGGYFVCGVSRLDKGSPINIG